MASFNNIKIGPELRPCYINGKRAFFHFWIKKKDIVMQSEYVVGLVEFINGTVEEIGVERIQFCDNKLEEYCFEKEENPCQQKVMK